ncbi:lovastatin nonaketide synthase [Nannizzia gypsea CBS 118893]|uniref:Non-reducing polyketide synthase nscA n=1 Tax=Arthroderma gypseum (strain ATCC MYA-4604 / CBS 118893) TaxID=535722 RepID=E5R176_ARTGP|nr:lovastatin nonaketide synthase [Nannizzia gypsea CBS 118893]EFQ98465.1 lovastatin nonaketide synthase [Nannizzia gypsea CBS 118893]
MPQRKEPIAIIGSACNFPGNSTTPSKLWELLKEPHDLSKPVPENRFNANVWHHQDNAHHGTSNVTKSYFLEADPATFDATFFNIPPNECEAIDPQQRMLLETVYESLCAAGVTMESLRGSSTACYVGLMCDDWAGMLAKDWDCLPQYAATGISRAIMANRISYFFDWHGPSMTIDTACSSSLVAVHEAVQVLRSGDCNVAVACGANLILTPGMYIAESKLKMLSPDGKSRMWDQGANGYARGEGLAAVVLKTLSQAIKDGDHIECVIRETAFNQDGRTTGITMPSNLAQTALIRETYKKAGLDPLDPNDQPQFFHAHGTGTPAGDPQEAEAISRAFFKDGQTAEKKLWVGSIKTIIGHTEGTAGLASLIGTSLALQNKTIPPNLHLNQIAEKVKPFYTNLQIPTTSHAWPSPPAGQPMRASVNSFGFGGANAHAILESYEPTAVHKICDKMPLFTPLTFSAHSEKSLRGMLDTFSEFLSAENSPDVSDVAWTLQNRRSALAHKVAISGRTTTDLVAAIDAARSQKDSLGVRSSGPEKLTVLGVFTGQGAQWPTMGSQLIKASAHVRNIIANLDRSLQELPEADSQAGLFVESLKPIKRLLAAGSNLDFKAVIGHSSGEIAAAYASGFISARDAIRIAYYRGLYAKFAGSASGKKGAMMAVGTTLEDAEEFCQLEEFDGRITVAASNAATSVTLSGDEDAIDAALVVFKDESKFVRKLRVDTAYHSFHMNACSEMYLKAMDACGIEFKDGHSSVSWYSSVVSGTKMASNNLNGQYWADNMNNAVLFSQAGITAVKESGPFDLVIEIGPHPALKGPCLENLEQATGVGGTPYTGLLSRGVDDVKAFSAALGYVWETFGPSAVDFEGYDKLMSSGTQRDNLSGDLPEYSWDHSRSYWLDSRVATSYTSREAPHPMLGVNVVEGTTGTQIQWRNILFPKELTWIPGHRLQGQNVFPASGYVCMAVEAIMTLASNRDVQLIELEEVDIARAISFLDDTTGIEVIFTLNVLSSESESISAIFQISSCPKGDNTLTLNGKGKISLRFGEPTANALSASQIPQFNMTSVDIDRFYKYLSDMGYNYSPPFKAISSILRRKDAAVGEITDARGEAWEDNFLMHPGFVDTSFQAVFAAFSSPGDDRLWSIHVPTKINRLSINPSLAVFPPGEEIVWPWQAAVTSGTHDTPTADIEVFAPNKNGVLMEIEGIVLVPLAKASEENDVKLFSNLIYDLAQPDGAVASPHRLPESDAHIARVSERFSFYWINKLLNTITAKEEEETLPHFKHMLRWCRFVHKQVIDGEHPFVGPDAVNDTLEYVESLVADAGDRADIGILRAVGQNIAHVIRTRGNIHEYALKDNILDRFYEEAIGLDITNQWEANLAAQVAYRYPRMNIIEIGAGTGGSTRMILPTLGKAFSTYTFTDISSGFFEAAEKRFSQYSDRMIFKTLDMEKDLSEQGFTEGHYDMVLASNVLHVGPDIDLTLSNVRKLVKPGGWLINMEVATYFPSLREGFSMSGFPGWWCGAETGRPWGPTITVEEWDKVYKRTGWSGVDTFTPNIDSIDHLVVMVTQAVDSQIYTLRDPLSPGHAHPQRENLVIIGGKTDKIANIVTECTNILRPHFRSISNVTSINNFINSDSDAVATVLNLAELDAPIMKELMDNQPQKLEGVKEVFSTPREILWVTKGNRSESPFSRMLVGMARTLRREYSGINFQALDVDILDSNSAKLFAETLLRHLNLNEANSRLVPGSILWSDESEYHLENNKIYTPRLMSADKMNDRYNSYKRHIAHKVSANASSIELTTKDSSYNLCEPSPLKPTTGSDGDTEITILKSLLQSVEVPLVGHFFLCYGTNDCGERVIALSDQSKSAVHVPKSWTILYNGETNATQVLLSIAANLVAHSIIMEASTSSTVLVHDPDQVVAAAIRKQAAAKKIRVFFTTTQTSKKGPQWTYIHPRTPRRLLRRQLPKEVSLFINFSSTSDEQIISNLLECLPLCCKKSNRSSFFGNSVAKRPGSDAELVSKYLSTGFDIAKTANFTVPDDRSTLPLDKVPGYFDETKDLVVIDWAVDTQVSLTVEPIDPYANLFSAEKTYLMVGLSGEMGQSLAEWMVSRGARHVVLTSRRPKVNAEWIESMEDEYGATIKPMPLDITDADALQACYNKICRTMPPIGGVAHGAMVLVDSLFQKMSYDDLMAALRPKVLGAINLDNLFSENTLDFFILFSSITALIGNAGQSNYIGANSFMESLGLQRRRKGLAASVIAISSLIGLGYFERAEDLDIDQFSRSGYRNVSEQDIHTLFAEAIVRGRPGTTESHEVVSGVVPTYADGDIRASYLKDTKFSHLILERTSAKQDGSSSTQIPVRIQLLTATTEEEVCDIMQSGFTRRIKKMLRIPEEDDFNATASLVEQGVDSLVAVEIRTWFIREVDIDMPVLKVLGGSSVSDLINDAMQRISPDLTPNLGSEGAKPEANTISTAPKVPSNPSKPVTVHDSAQPTREAEPQVEITKATPAASSIPTIASTTEPVVKPSTEIHENKSGQHSFDRLAKSEVTEKMSFGQSRFWFLNQALQDKTTFNMAILVRLSGRIRVKDMERALEAVVLRHDALRTRYFSTGEYMESPMQGIIPTSAVKLVVKHCKDESGAYRELDEIRSHVWDLNSWETMKVTLLSSSETMHYLVIGCHHIGMDGFSFNVFYSDLEKAYEGQKLPSIPKSAQYGAFAQKQREDWDNGNMNADLAYYRETIPSNLNPIPLFPFAKISTRLPLDTYGTYSADVRIEPALTRRIKAASRSLGSTTFHFYLAALQALVFRQLDDCDEFFIGVADANRTDDKFINTLGFFLNLLPVRFERYAAKKFGDAVQQVRNKVYKGLAHSKLPFDVLLDELKIPRSATSTPIFQVFVDYRQGVQERQKYMGLDAVGEKWHLARTGYDMTLDIVENAAGDTRLELRLQQRLYTAEHTKLLLEGYVNLLTAFADNPAVDWSAPAVWDRKTINEAIEVGRGPFLQYEWAPTVMHHIDDIVSQHGTNICLKDGTGKIMTYSQMARRVDCICSALVAANVMEGDTVAVFQQPTADWVCSLLAIFRAGAVYVPLDLRTPFPRLAAIVDQARPRVILAHSQTLGDVEHLNAPTSAVVDINNLPVNSPEMPNLAKSDTLAVILFTSGSTGVPKGIHINHSNIVKQLEGCSKQFEFKDSASYVLHQTAYSFDKSLEQIFTALVHGGALYVVPAEQRGDPISITNIMASEGITHTATTPSEYLMWFRYARENLLKCKSWKCALLGGEVASDAVLEEFRKLGMPIRLLDSYGPAEITMSCAKVELPYRSMVTGQQAPVGFMLPNYSVVIVDPKMNPLPLGFAGEIVIGGVGVAEGYLSNDELTRRKFIPNNFGGEGTVYRTGDKGRLTEEGALFFDGRIDGDTQIKLRGVRIELEDIESTILQASAGALTHAVVTIRGEQDSAFLVAHVVFSAAYTEYRDELLTRLPMLLPLPQYMIPTIFVSLDNLPFTTHFKVDRKAVQALPIPEAENKSSEDLTERTETEYQVAGLWNQIIPAARALTPSADFFHAGGNSLMLVKLQAMIRQTFGVSIQLFDIMNAGTLRNMARLIDDALGVKELDWNAETDLPAFPKLNSDLSSPKQKDMVVMMTGATGVLGRNILAHLVSEDRISKIYTLAVRPQNGVSTLTRIPDPKGKIIIKHGDLDRARLGLSEKEATLLSSEVDVILHLGANRSFWDSYYHLRATNVSSVKEIVKIAYPRKVPIHFVSSGGVTMYSGSFPPTNGHDGYVASKWAAEKVLANAANELGLRAVLHRPTKAPGAITTAPDEILNELLALVKQAQRRPDLEGLSGSLGIVPLERIAGKIVGSIFDTESIESGHPEVLAHSSALNVSIKDFADKILQDKSLSTLEGMPALKWMGVAKKMGWSQFMVGHEISMTNSKDQIVSTR